MRKLLAALVAALICLTPFIGLTWSSLAAARAFQKAEADRWWPIIKASGIKAE